MNTLILTTALAAISCGAVWAESLPARQQNQRQRISQGVRSGQLTRVETEALCRQQQSIHNQVQRDRLDGGAFTPAERARARQRLNNASQDIHRLKHNGRTR